MVMAYLLDTNCWIVYLKSVTSSIRANLEKLKPTDVVLCSVVKAELFHGAEKHGNRARRLQKLAQTFAPFASLPFDDTAAAAYGLIRHELEVAGAIIGPYDLMIAAYKSL
jgi:tRNA(fMet)-specific endonuclease VapC